MVDSLKGAYDAAVKQYTANQGQDNADRTFKLQVEQLQQQAEQHAQTIAMEYAKIDAGKKSAKEQKDAVAEYMAKSLYDAGMPMGLTAAQQQAWAQANQADIAKEVRAKRTNAEYDGKLKEYTTNKNASWNPAYTLFNAPPTR
jgi:hypothetical protein